MKTMTSILFSLLLVAAGISTGLAQNSGTTNVPPLPVVTIAASDADATEPGLGSTPAGATNTAAFVVRRTGGVTNSALAVAYAISGSAYNGIDYAALSGQVIIPQNATSAQIVVRPLADNLMEGNETVTLTLRATGCPTNTPAVSNCYILGNVGTATAVIHDAVVNPLPVVTVLASDPQASEPVPLLPAINAGAFTFRRTGNLGTELQVLYTIGGTASNGLDFVAIPASIVIPTGRAEMAIQIVPLSDDLVEGTETVTLTLPPLACATIYPPPAGCYAVGASNSATVFIANTTSTSNTPPTVSIIAPTNGATFTAPANIVICALAEDRDGALVSVELFAGTNRLGLITGTVAGQRFFYFAWSNAPAGPCALTAKATDNRGATTVSAPIAITVREVMPLPVVTIVVSDATAAEIPVVPVGLGMPQLIDPAVFTVSRTGPTDAALEVFYSTGGTALNGADYTQLSRRLTIPAGTNAAPITVLPIDDFLVESNETVILTLLPATSSGTTNPAHAAYIIGTPASATAIIIDNDRPTNNPPTVRITMPFNGAVFTAPTNITLIALAEDRDDPVATVEFFDGTNRLGLGTNNPLVMTPMNPFLLVWSNAPVGQHVLTARATDARGASAVSAPVTITVRASTQPSFVTRYLPAWYVPGIKLTVRLYARPTSTTTTYVVADTPPANWIVGAISAGGALVASNGQVVFGPFADNQTRAFTYELTPPATETGMKEFSGAASANGVASTIAGARYILPAPLHPADINPTNQVLSTEELAAYVAAWKGCTRWSISPNPIPINYVTRAGFLVQGGGAYTFSTNVPTPYPPLLWVNQNPSPEPFVYFLAGNTASGIWSSNLPGAAVSVMPTNYQPGVPFTVSITVTPPTNIVASAVEDMIPAGWTASVISDAGVFCPTTRKVTWGLFLDQAARTLTYRVTPPTNATAIGRFSGTASFDGYNRPITGRREVVRQSGVTPPTPPVIRTVMPGENLLNFLGTAGANYRLETSTNLLDWVPMETLLNTDGTLQYIDVAATNYVRRFYRAVPE